MSQSLPTHALRFLQREEISTVKLQDLSEDDEDGYILELDLPLAPESLVIDHCMYSPTQKLVFPESAIQKKLTPNLQDKFKYCISNLVFWLPKYTGYYHLCNRHGSRLI